MKWSIYKEECLEVDLCHKIQVSQRWVEQDNSKGEHEGYSWK